MALRIGIAGVWHETNTFAPGTTGLAEFEAYQLQEGEALLRAHAGAGTEIGGALAACGELGVEAVPLLFAAAVPGPLVEAAARRALCERLLARLEAAGPLDGLVLCLHGAMVAADVDDPDSQLLAEVRRLRPGLPVAVTLDLHANPGADLLEWAALVAGYDSYPHVDMYERGREAAGRLVAGLRTGARGALAWRRLPLLSCPLGQETAAEPMRGLVELAHRLEQRPGMGPVSVLPGYPYADVDRLGLTVVACAGSDTAAREAADELAAAAWERREAFGRELVPPAEAVERALASPGPVVLADVADNVGGGAPGDGTVLLEALLAADARGAVVLLHDPAAAAAAAAAGRGARLRLTVGGKTDELHGPPVPVEGRVVEAGSIAYRRSGSYMRGTQVELGPTALLELGGVELALTSRRVMPFDADHLRALGIDPAERQAIVVKSAIAWKAAFGDVARDAIAVDTPGVCTCRLERLPFTKVARVWPLDAAAAPGYVGGSSR